MPELPEVETTRRGLLPHVVGRRIRGAVVRNGNLRWPVRADLRKRLRGEEVLGIRRRGKYLLFDCATATCWCTSACRGASRWCPTTRPRAARPRRRAARGPRALRLTDPRRFGAMLWLPGRRRATRCSRASGSSRSSRVRRRALQRIARGRRVSVKHFLMNARIVTGVGNIYASEALFQAGIHPMRSVARISRERWDRLAVAVRETLQRALDAGGTTLRDYARADGTPGDFQNATAVYGREGCRAGAAARRSARSARASARPSTAPRASDELDRHRHLGDPRASARGKPRRAQAVARVDVRFARRLPPLGDGEPRARRADRRAPRLPRAAPDRRAAHRRFVAEFSRGKTELINALFFGDLGTRLLPSGLGRTTLCPTEILWDPTRAPSIRLLPIGTRESPKALREFIAEIDTWKEIPLDPKHPEAVAEACLAISESMSVAARRP
jgi:formamidopyrimidine-DNA glycosylase